MPVFSPANSFSSVSGNALTPPPKTCSRDTILPFGQPARKLSHRLRVAVRVVEHHHPGHRCARQDQREVVGRATDPLGVVLRGCSADHNPRTAREPGQCGVEDLPADVVEVDVEPWVLAQRPPDRLALVIDRRIKPELVDDPRAFVGAARDPDHGAVLQLRDLARDAADRAGGTGNEHGLAVGQPADVQQSEVRGQTGHPKRAEVGW